MSLLQIYNANESQPEPAVYDPPYLTATQIENNSSNKSPRSASSRHAFVDEYEMDAERGNSASARQIRDEGGEDGCCAALLTFFSILLCIVTFPISIWMVVKQVQVRGTTFGLIKWIVRH